MTSESPVTPALPRVRTGVMAHMDKEGGAAVGSARRRSDAIRQVLIFVGFFGTLFALGAIWEGAQAAYEKLNSYGWIRHRATALVTIEKGRPWLEGETRSCTLFPTQPNLLMYCEWLVAPPEGESHELPILFHGRVDRRNLPPGQNNWRCRRESVGFFQDYALTCWALN